MMVREAKEDIRREHADAGAPMRFPREIFLVDDFRP